MDEIEKAIKWFENRKSGATLPGARDMHDIALAALREKQEQEKGCVYCNNNKQLISREFPDEIFGTINYSEWQIIVDRGFLRLGSTDDMQCLDHGEKIKINYCPMCGRRLEGGQ